MMTRVLIVIGVVAILILFLYTLSHKTEPIHPLVGKPAPLQVFENPDYVHPHLSQDQSPFLVYFTASWCPHCRAIEKLLIPLGIPLYIVLYRDEKLPSPALLNKTIKLVKDPKMEKGLLWGIKGVPSLFLVGKDGTVLWHSAGRLDEPTIQNTLLPLLKPKSANDDASDN